MTNKVASGTAATLMLIGQLTLGAACAANTAPREVSRDDEAISDDGLIASTVCSSELDADSQVWFGGLQAVRFERQVYADRVDLTTVLSMSGEFGELTGNASHPPDSSGVVTVSMQTGRFDVGSDNYIGLAKKFQKDGTPGAEIIRLSYVQLVPIADDSGEVPENPSYWEAPPFVLQFNKTGDDCAHTVY